MLKVGTPAPTFVAESTQGIIRLQDYFGKSNIILIFYPKDNSALCVQQLNELQKYVEEFSRLDAVIIGINQDSLESHSKFAEEHGYTFPLVSDIGQKISVLYEVGTNEENPELIERVVYVIDPDGVIHFAVKGKPSIAQIMDAIEAV